MYHKVLIVKFLWTTWCFLTGLSWKNKMGKDTLLPCYLFPNLLKSVWFLLNACPFPSSTGLTYTISHLTMQSWENASLIKSFTRVSSGLSCVCVELNSDLLQQCNGSRLEVKAYCVFLRPCSTPRNTGLHLSARVEWDLACDPGRVGSSI